MAKGDFRKPQKMREYVKAERQRTEAEDDHSFKVEAAMADQDYSAQGDVELSDEEFLKRTRMSLISNVLPTPPKIPGYHVCWVASQSNNTYDSVDFRRGIGYSLVKPEEVPGFISPSNRSGQVEGCVSHNELILMKVPERLYQLLMRDVHHLQPNDQEGVIKQRIAEMTDSEGNDITRDVHEMTGINKLARKVPESKFY